MSDPRAERQEALQQVLAQLSGRGGAEAYTPEALAELARRAGVTDPAQLANLGRALGATPAMGDTIGIPQHVLFLVGETECALPAEAVQGVERITDVTQVPNTVSWVKGVVQVWGAIVSVVDLQAFVGLPAQAITSRSRLVVVSRHDVVIGFLVGAVTEMRPLGDQVASRLDPRGVPEWARPFAQDAILLEGRSVVLLDPDRLLANDRLQRYKAE
jgi:purine-binding chemotaxis protein CheW